MSGFALNPDTTNGQKSVHIRRWAQGLSPRWACALKRCLCWFLLWGPMPGLLKLSLSPESCVEFTWQFFRQTGTWLGLIFSSERKMTSQRANSAHWRGSDSNTKEEYQPTFTCSLTSCPHLMTCSLCACQSVCESQWECHIILRHRRTETGDQKQIERDRQAIVRQFTELYASLVVRKAPVNIH